MDSSSNIVFTNNEIETKQEGKQDFANLPGWATWSAAEAEQWIEDNVTNLATAKTALKAMARAIVYLRKASAGQ